MAERASLSTVFKLPVVLCVTATFVTSVVSNSTEPVKTNASQVFSDVTDVTWTTLRAYTATSCAPAERCQNGLESGSCPQNATCDCSVDDTGVAYFWGATCSKLNLMVTSRVASKRSLVITWNTDPGLNGKYYFVFRKSTSDSDAHIYIESLKQVNERAVRLINLDPGSSDYVVCLMDQELAGIVYTTKNTSRLDVKYHDCVLVSSQSSTVWSQQLAFYLICAGMALVLLVIFFVGCVKESLDKRNYHLFDTGMEQEEHEVDDVQDISSDKDEVDNTCAIEDTNSDIAMETV